MSENQIRLLTPNAKRVRVAIGLLGPYLIVQSLLTATDKVIYWSPMWALLMFFGGVGLMALAIRPMRGFRLAVPQAFGMAGLLGRELAIIIAQITGRLPALLGPAISGTIQWAIGALFVFLAGQALAGRASAAAPD